MTNDRLVTYINNIKPTTLLSLYDIPRAKEVAAAFTSTKLETISDTTTVFENMGYGSSSATEAQKFIDHCTTKLKAHIEKKSKRTGNKLSNRAEYLNEPVLTFQEAMLKERDSDGNVVKDDEGKVVYVEGTRWNGDSDLVCSGVMARAIEYWHGPQSEPGVLRIVNALPQTGDPDEDAIPDNEFQNLNDHGVTVSGARMAIPQSTLWHQYAVNMFPQAKDFAAYVHSLKAPILPQATFNDSTVRFQKLTVQKVEEMEVNGKTFCTTVEQDLETDGSGLLNIDHPDVQEFVEKYGVAVAQVRAVHLKNGIMAKGVLRPVRLGAPMTRVTTREERWDEESQSWILVSSSEE